MGDDGPAARLIIDAADRRQKAVPGVTSSSLNQTVCIVAAYGVNFMFVFLCQLSGDKRTALPATPKLPAGTSMMNTTTFLGFARSEIFASNNRVPKIDIQGSLQHYFW